MIENVEIAKIRRDGGTQPRAALDEATIGEYAEAIQAGAEFPPVDVFNDGERLWLADGFHRIVAHERAGKHFVLAILHQGSQRDAVLFSTGVNAEHGLRRSNADKRRSVEVLLRDPEWGKWSDTEIARQAKVDRRLVAEMRLSCTNVQDSTPTERTVSRGGTTYTMNTAQIGPAFATAEQLQAAVRSWLGVRWPGKPGAQRTALSLISQGTSYGMDHLNQLAEYARKAGLRVLLADLKKAAAAVATELAAPELPASVTYRATGAPADGPAVEPNGPGIRSEEEVAQAAVALEPRVWEWLKLSEPPRMAELENGKRLCGSLLDLEGWHARRGRNFDWEALIGFLGNGTDHEALRRAIRTVWERILALLESVEEPATALRSAQDDVPAVQDDTPAEEEEEEEEPDVIGQWLAQMAEENEIPRKRNGEPEPEAVRIMLRNMLGDRGNGGGVAWRSLRQSPAWPAGTADGEKLAAVRSYLAAMPASPTVPPYARPLPVGNVSPVRGFDDMARTLARKIEQIHRMQVAIDKALGYCKSLASHQDEPDDDLIETIAVLEAARNHQD